MNLYRPTYHFLPEKNWMNDPNGPLYYNGQYHLFYQYNPDSDHWDNMHWGHAKSADLVHWEHMPIALSPSRDQGETHCFSGCAVLDNGIPTIIYTSVGDGERNFRYGSQQWLASSKDGMVSFQKEPCPALTIDIHGGQNILEWRDPFAWRENGEWQMVIGGSFNGKGCVLRYRSNDLRRWEYLGVLFENDDYPYLECPNLLTIGKKRILFYSPGADVQYHIGTIGDDGRFQIEKSGILDHSRKSFYAPNTLLNDPKGRMLTWGWLPDEGRGHTFSGWAGVMSMPRVLSLDEGGLLQDPAEEYEILRGEEETLSVRKLNGGKAMFQHRGRALEILIEAELAETDEFSVVVLATPDGREETRIRYAAETGALTLEKGLSSAALNVSRRFQRAIVPLENGKLTLRLFLDYSVLELFANQRETITGRLYPTQTDSDMVYLEGTAKKITARLWTMAGAPVLGEKTEG